ncbi:hypothetical protein [Methylorubrum extorquens]
MNITQPSFEVPADMRDFVEKSVEQARTAISAFMQNARRATSCSASHGAPLTRASFN